MDAAMAFRSGAALGTSVSQGSRAGNMRMRSNAPHSLSSRCHTASGASSSGRSFADAAQQQRRSGQASASKYDRIVAFVDAHATPVLAAAAAVDTSINCYHTGEFEQPAWHNSYDEEAEEGEMDNAPQVLAFASAAAPAATAAAPAAAADAATVVVSSWSYGNLSNPKPWCYSWDEEAEGAFELAECVRLSPAHAQADRRAALHEARHAARLTRKMRRSQLHPQLGDLEHMQAWVGAQEQLQKQQNQQQQRSASSGPKYQQLLAFVAGDAASGQYRKPMQWHLTFDEDVHGPDAPETVLGSC